MDHDYSSFKTDVMQIVERLVAPTPPFFRRVRTLGLILTAVGTAVIGIPDLPDSVSNAAGILAVAGTVMTGVSQTAVRRE